MFLDTFVDTFVDTFLDTFVDTFVDTFIDTFLDTLFLPAVVATIYTLGAVPGLWRLVSARAPHSCAKFSWQHEYHALLGEASDAREFS